MKKRPSSRDRRPPRRKANTRQPKKPREDPREAWLRRTRVRIVAVGLVPILMLVASVAVAGYLQLGRHDVYVREAERNYMRRITLDDTRGQVLDRNGALLASSVDVHSVVADPKLVEDPELTAELLAEALGLPFGEVYQRITRKTRFVYLKRKIPARESRRVKSLDLTGIYLQRESQRFYPKKELAGQVLGIVGLEHQGLEGVELAYDAELRGQTAHIPALRDTHGRLSFPEAIPAIPRFAGNTLVLSIDEKIQQQVEFILEQAVITSRALTGMAVVMDVATGELLALGNVPRFNPNNFRDFPYERRRNRTMNDIFEPGSTFKMFTLAAALDVGVVTMEDVLDTENGYYRVARHVIHDTHPHSLLDVWDTVKYSSNIGFTKLGELIGRELLHQYLDDFGFGRRPGTGLQGEARGVLRPVRDWAPVTFANITFGQGVSTSAVQLVRAMAAIANGGRLMRPLLVREIRDSNGNALFRNTPRMEKQVVSEAVAHQVMAALARVVEEGGTGTSAASNLYDVVGKTGTAQKPDLLIGGYSPHAWIGSFLGAAPAENPRIAVLVMIDEPLGKEYGGVVAAPAFREIVDWTLDYLRVAPARVPVRVQARIREGAGVAEALRRADRASAAPAVTPVADDEGQLAGEVYVPDFRGLPLRDVRDLAHEVRLQPWFRGGGVAVSQTPLPGVRVSAWSEVEIRFRPME